MSIDEAATARLRDRADTDYADGGHRNVFTGDLNAVGTVGRDVAAVVATLEALRDAVLAVAGETAGIGGGVMDVPRNGSLGAAAYRDGRAVTGLYTRGIAAAATLSPADMGRVIVCSGSTYTVTLPAAADCGPGWWCVVKNNASGTVTLDGDGAETIDGAATLNLASGEAATLVWSGAGAFITF